MKTHAFFRRAESTLIDARARDANANDDFIENGEATCDDDAESKIVKDAYAHEKYSSKFVVHDDGLGND